MKHYYLYTMVLLISRNHLLNISANPSIVHDLDDHIFITTLYLLLIGSFNRIIQQVKKPKSSKTVFLFDVLQMASIVTQSQSNKFWG